MMTKWDDKSILEEIYDKQRTTFYLGYNFRNSLPVKSRGLYWIWTNLTFDDLRERQPLENDGQRKINKSEVNFAERVCEQRGLPNICEFKHEDHPDFTIVYNGIGGCETGLRARINQEMKCNSPGTGTLNLLREPFNNVNNWAVSYFDFDDKENEGIVKHMQDSIVAHARLDDPDNEELVKHLKLLTYLKYAQYLEERWRIKYGKPILTKR